MGKLDYLTNNIISNRWKEKYDKCSQEQKEKLDKLHDSKVEEYQLQVIKRKRVYPEIGDIFQIVPREDIVFFGIVVSNHINNNCGDDLIVIFIFNKDIDVSKIKNNEIKKEDLLIDPAIVGKEYWSKGFFSNIDHIDDVNFDNYGFYSIGKRKFLDEYGNELTNEPNLLGTYGVATISGIAHEINKEMIIKEMI